jgi:hypothetical protein
MARSSLGQARVEICRGWLRRPANYFSESVDLIMDNKKFEIPTWATAKRFSKMSRVRFHLRTPGEGASALAVYARLCVDDRYVAAAGKVPARGASCAAVWRLAAVWCLAAEVQEGFTKPNAKKQRVNPGASMNVCAGIVKSKVGWSFNRPPASSTQG